MYQHNNIIKKVYNNNGRKYIVIIREPKTFYFDFDLHKDLDKNLKHKTEFIIKRNISLPENKIKNKIEQLLSKYKHENNKTNGPHKFVLSLSQILDLRNSNRHMYPLYVEKCNKTV